MVGRASPHVSFEGGGLAEAIAGAARAVETCRLDGLRKHTHNSMAAT